MVWSHNERRHLPRYPIHQERVKIFLEDHDKVFGIRDISMSGLGIELLEHSEMLLFPMGSHHHAEAELRDKSFTVDLEVTRKGAASIGFHFLNLKDEARKEIEYVIDPIRIGRSLKPVAIEEAPDAMAAGLTSWYHGDMNSDLYLWLGVNSDVNRSLLCWNGCFWEWSTTEGSRTGEVEHEESDKVQLHYEDVPLHRMVYQARKILENTEVLDYRLVDFLLKTE